MILVFYLLTFVTTFQHNSKPHLLLKLIHSEFLSSNPTWKHLSVSALGSALARLWLCPLGLGFLLVEQMCVGFALANLVCALVAWALSVAARISIGNCIAGAECCCQQRQQPQWQRICSLQWQCSCSLVGSASGLVLLISGFALGA